MFLIKTFINLGSSCIYPKKAKQPIKEEYLLSGKLEPTNEAYALAKIIGVKSCEYYNRQFKTNYFTLMPCNLYGPNDNFNIKNSHFIPALIKKFINSKHLEGGITILIIEFFELLNSSKLFNFFQNKIDW